jgi:nicotinamidase-related amidase
MNSPSRNRVNLVLSLLSAAVFMLTACAGHQLDVTPISKAENPQQLVNDLDNAIAMARKNQVNVLAPTWFRRAETSLNAAKAGLEKGSLLSDILEDVASARTQLQQAEAIAKTARSTIPDAIKARDLARQAGAMNLGSEYTTVEYSFLDLTGAIEKNDLAYAKRRQAAVAEQYRRIELRSIKIQTIGEVRRLIDEARKKGQHRIAPQSFAAAQKKLTEADNFITENPYQKEKMHQLAAEALFMARRINPVAVETEKVDDMDPEQIVLWAEGILHQTTQKLGAPDMRDHAFDEQLENILATISAQQADHEFMIENSKKQQGEIEKLQKNIANLEGQTIKEQKEKERLLAEKKFNEKLSSIQHYFKPHEAEV